MALGARTWYPAHDERNGTYQLRRAEERAIEAHADNLRRIDRLQELRMRRELSRMGRDFAPGRTVSLPPLRFG